MSSAGDKKLLLELSYEQHIAVLFKNISLIARRFYFINVDTRWLRRSVEAAIPAFICMSSIEYNLSPPVENAEIIQRKRPMIVDSSAQCRLKYGVAANAPRREQCHPLATM